MAEELNEDPQWQVRVRVPMRLPGDMRDELFSVVVAAVEGWEPAPAERDGWDADVDGCPEGDRLSYRDSQLLLWLHAEAVWRHRTDVDHLVEERDAATAQVWQRFVHEQDLLRKETASRQAWAEEAARLEGSFVTLPEEIRVAAATISRDIYEAMDVIYGEIGGKADTAQDVADTTKVIADDIRRVLDFVASLDYHAGQRVEWNTTGNQWVKATVADACAFDGPDGRVSPLLSVEVDDTGRVLNVDRRHLRQSWTSEEAGSPACACVTDEQAEQIESAGPLWVRPQCAVHPDSSGVDLPVEGGGPTP